MEKSENKKAQFVPEDQKLQELKSIGLVINTVVHCFNNSIGVIRGYADLSLRATEPDDRIYPYLKNILDGADSMKELSDKMRILGKQGKQELEPMQIHSVVEEAISTFTSTLASPIKLQKNIDATCGAILADPGQIHQLVTNLCNNAYYAIRDQGGEIEVILNEIDVDASFAQAYRELSEGRHLKLTVKDTGIGMEKEILKQIFEPFFTTQETGEISGLGLTIVQGIVKNYKGIITVESKPSEGTTFDIYLPLASNSIQNKEG